MTGGITLEISNEIIFNIIQDWKKKDIHPIDRAKLIEEYRKSLDISQRELARRMDISHSTLQDWISMGRIRKQDYDKLISTGSKVTDVYRTLRTNRLENLAGVSDLDILLDRVINRLRKPFKVTKVTFDRAQRLITELGKIKL